MQRTWAVYSRSWKALLQLRITVLSVDIGSMLKLQPVYVVLKSPTGSSALGQKSAPGPFAQPEGRGLFTGPSAALGALGLLVLIAVGVRLLYTAIPAGVRLVDNAIQSDREDADVAAANFHDLYDRGDYAAIWALSHPILQDAVAQELMADRLAQIKGKLGTHERQVRLACTSSSITSGRKMLRAEYWVQFQNGEAWETYDWLFRGKSYQLVSYSVESDLQGDKFAWQASMGPAIMIPYLDSCSDGDIIWWDLEGWPATGP
jgi:hypothetical protein